MAQKIQMKHKDTGIMKTGFYGFSWTTLFFGFFPALFRGDFVTFIGACVVLILIGIGTAGIGAFIAMLIWAFLYNSFYTKKLLEKGYVFSGSKQENIEAATALGVQRVSEEVKTDEKSCPYCGEKILAVAIKCKHCQSELK